jgi:gluconate 5-dehydrogenase
MSVWSGQQDMNVTEAFSLHGHRALVTGGGSGIGLGIARCFVAAGAEVMIAGRTRAKLEAACVELGGKVKAMTFDVTEAEAAEAFAGAVERECWPISILVNNAGSNVKKPLREMTLEDFRSVLDAHVTGAFALTRAFLPQLARSGRGSVLFTASMASFLGLTQVLAYSAAKSAYLGMVRALAAELAPEGIRVNGVAPGWIDTPLFRQIVVPDAARYAKIKTRIPLQRVGTPEDIGWAMTYLASDAAAYVTGHTLVVDGGAVCAL